jgi:hypothetical protein
VGRILKLIVITPAGRERYLRLLSHYVLRSPEVAEWHLWDNCRTAEDRKYLRELAASDPRCRIKEIPGSDGTNIFISRFFEFCDDPDALYLRLDDDVVYVQEDFFPRFVERAVAERENAAWFAPMIINNAICTWLLKHRSAFHFEGPVTPEATCRFVWRRPQAAIALHPLFIEAVKTGRRDVFKVPDETIRLARFSINAIGFFGSTKKALGDKFCPPGVDDEEWLTVVMPLYARKPGMIFGDMFVAHFSFVTQERFILRTDILNQYYALAGLTPPPFKMPPLTWGDKLNVWRQPSSITRLKYRMALP